MSLTCVNSLLSCLPLIGLVKSSQYDSDVRQSILKDQSLKIAEGGDTAIEVSLENVQDRQALAEKIKTLSKLKIYFFISLVTSVVAIVVLARYGAGLNAAQLGTLLMRPIKPFLGPTGVKISSYVLGVFAGILYPVYTCFQLWTNRNAIKQLKNKDIKNAIIEIF